MKAQRTYSNEARFVAHAREFVTESIGPVPRAFLFDVQLMTSELVNNAILHAASECTVSVEVRDELITVAVTDTGEGDPTVRSPDDASLSGRGLMIVAALSRAWGIDPASPAPGKTVWFTVERPPLLDAADAEARFDAADQAGSSTTPTSASSMRGGVVGPRRLVLWSTVFALPRRVAMWPGSTARAKV